MGGTLMADDITAKVLVELGELRGELIQIRTQHVESQRQREALWKKLDSQSNDTSEVKGMVREILLEYKNLKERINVLEEENEELADEVKELIALRNKGMGIIAMIGFLGAGGGYFATKFFGN